MLILAMAGALTASMPDTTTLVPGTRLHLGMTESSVVARIASTSEVRPPDAGGMTARQGHAKFFGIPCEATYYFRDGRLARARFQATGVSPHARDYVEDQLRRSGLRRECQRYEPEDRQCDWRAASVEVRLQLQEDRLEARIDPWPPRRGVESRASALGGQAGTAGADSAGAEEAVGSGGLSAGRVEGGMTAATLPETLVISLVSRNSPSDWPRIVSAPPMDSLPNAARRHAQGVMWVLALVDSDGRVLRATAEEGLDGLDQAAVAWVSRARFAPCERQGRPCRFHVRVAVRLKPQ